MNRKDIRLLGIGNCVMAQPSSWRRLPRVWTVLPHIALLVLYCTTLPDGSPLETQVGVHAGEALVVPLNGNGNRNGNGINDYFGLTVNVAAPVDTTIREIPN
jgi:hypothetical protein